MRYLILIRDISPGEPHPDLQARLAGFTDALATHGALLDAASLHGTPLPPAGAPARPADGGLAAYALIQARTPDEAREWGRRFPAVPGARLEIWPLREPAVRGMAAVRPGA